MAPLRIIYIFILTVSLFKYHSCSSNLNSRSSPIYSMNSLNLVTILDHKYFFSDFTLSWIDALRFCRNYGMELVKVDTIEENVRIKNYMETLTDITIFSFLTSAHRIGRDTFKWADGTEIDPAILDWCPDQPDFVNGRDYCLGYMYSTDKFCWADYNCSPAMISNVTAIYSYYFICEETI